MNIYARQGDLVFNRVSAVTGELKKQTDFVLAGRDSAPHTIRGTSQVRTDGRIHHVRVAESTLVTHAGRHEPITLEPGDYTIRPLREGNDSFVDD